MPANIVEQNPIKLDLTIEGTLFVRKTSQFFPVGEALLFYYSFYLFGWFLYGSKNLVEGLVQFDWFCVFLASTPQVLKVICLIHLNDVFLMTLNSLVTWLFIFGLIGLFIRYFSYYSAKMRVVSDASYWIYLIHLPFIVLFPGSVIFVV